MTQCALLVCQDAPVGGIAGDLPLASANLPAQPSQCAIEKLSSASAASTLTVFLASVGFHNAFCVQVAWTAGASRRLRL
jgi:hypothetical protein